MYSRFYLHTCTVYIRNCNGGFYKLLLCRYHVFPDIFLVDSFAIDFWLVRSAWRHWGIGTALHISQFSLNRLLITEIWYVVSTLYITVFKGENRSHNFSSHDMTRLAVFLHVTTEDRGICLKQDPPPNKTKHNLT